MGWKDIYKKHFLESKNKLACIPQANHLKDAFTSIEKRLNNGGYELKRDHQWDPLALFIYRYPEESITEFESDIELVVRNSSSERKADILSFLESEEDRIFVAGRFEIFIKSRLLRCFGHSVDLDYQLPNGRSADARIFMKKRYYFIECTVRTDTDESRQRFEAGIRHGFEDPYHHCKIFYEKVFDKVAKGLDPNRSQLSDIYPNLLLILFYTPFSGLSEEGPSINWALEELLGEQPSSRTFEGSLFNWLDERLPDLYGDNLKNNLEEFNRRRDSLFASLRKISAIMLFDSRCKVSSSRINYCSNEMQKLSHLEMAMFDELFKNPPSWAT